MEDIAWIDVFIFVLYMVVMLLVGIYFMHKNETKDDYYVGGRSMSAGHIGLSVVATDVGGGFSIGLGGLGFAIGLSANWMLFTGLVGAWVSTVILIPKVYPIGREFGLLSFPEVLKNRYDGRVAIFAGVISFIGYLGFTSSQILAGAKLASATFDSLTVPDAVLGMGLIAVVYTVAGGLKAVIYTDTIQWLILMFGLFFIGIPFGYHHLGGWHEIQKTLPEGYLSLTGISLSQFINWMLTIVPIWFIGMTLYQRMFACKDQKTAIRAWRIAGLFEWPIMAFLGVILGIFAKVAVDQGLFHLWGEQPITDPELGLPIFLKHILPAGLLGLMMSAYFSAIMSTADSCLMAASGNFMTDILRPIKKSLADNIRIAQLSTLLIGAVAIYIASQMEEVLTLMLHSYAFMVSGLLVPVLMMLAIKRPSPVAALTAMITGGVVTLGITLAGIPMPMGLDPIFYGLISSLLAFSGVQHTHQKARKSKTPNV